MRGATYYAIVDNVKLYSSPAIGTAVSTLKRNDEAGVSTGNITTTDGDQFLELIRISDQKKLYVLLNDVAMNPAYGGNTLPDVTVKPSNTSTDTDTSTRSGLANLVHKRPALAYASLGVVLVGIGALVAKLK